MIEVKDNFRPKCSNCEFLDIETNMTTAYADNRVHAREIIVGCKNSTVCDTLEQKFKEGAKANEN